MDNEGDSILLTDSNLYSLYIYLIEDVELYLW